MSFNHEHPVWPYLKAMFRRVEKHPLSIKGSYFRHLSESPEEIDLMLERCSTPIPGFVADCKPFHLFVAGDKGAFEKTRGLLMSWWSELPPLIADCSINVVVFPTISYEESNEGTLAKGYENGTLGGMALPEHKSIILSTTDGKKALRYAFFHEMGHMLHHPGKISFSSKGTPLEYWQKIAEGDWDTNSGIRKITKQIGAEFTSLSIPLDSTDILIPLNSPTASCQSIIRNKQNICWDEDFADSFAMYVMDKECAGLPISTAVRNDESVGGFRFTSPMGDVNPRFAELFPNRSRALEALYAQDNKPCRKFGSVGTFVVKAFKNLPKSPVAEASFQFSRH